MIAVDTNVLVRYMAKDDPQQTHDATDFLAANRCLVLHTVLLETVWVLGSKTGYRWERGQIVARVRDILGLPNLAVVNPAAVSLALAWYESGMDFADALHLANSGGLFATFDQRLGDKAEKLRSHPKVIVLGSKDH